MFPEVPYIWNSAAFEGIKRRFDSGFQDSTKNARVIRMVRLVRLVKLYKFIAERRRIRMIEEEVCLY